MQVNVFVAPEDGQGKERYLLLPVSPTAAIPLQYQQGWRFYGTLDSQSAMFRGVAVELQLQAKGFALVEPPIPSVWS